MPNWCNNNVTIYGPKAKVKAIKSAYEAGEFCQHILPNPKGEWDYDWSVNNWGTKWDVGGSDDIPLPGTSKIHLPGSVCCCRLFIVLQSSYLNLVNAILI